MKKEMKHVNDQKQRMLPLSEFAKFSSNLKGLQLFKSGKAIDKWEAFSGHDNSVDILMGTSKISYRKKIDLGY